MRGLVIFLIVAVVIASLILVLSINNYEIEKNKNNEIKNFEFSTFTSAVCESKGDFVYCKDEVFMNCNGEISKLKEVAECDGIELDVPKVNGFAVFEKEWKDTRGQ